MFGIPLTATALKFSLIGLLVLGGLLVASNLLWRASYKSAKADVVTITAERDELQGRLNTAIGNAIEANNQHDVTIASLTRTTGELIACQGEASFNKEENRRVEILLRKEIDNTKAALQRMASNTAKALRDPSCAFCASQPICPVLLE